MRSQSINLLVYKVSSVRILASFHIFTNQNVAAYLAQNYVEIVIAIRNRISTEGQRRRSRGDGGTGETRISGWRDRNVVCPPPTFGPAHS